MISKNQIKYIHSLQAKKGRLASNTFVAEGPKVVHDLLAAFQPHQLFATKQWLCSQLNLLVATFPQLNNAQIVEVSADELKKISFLQHPQDVLCVFEQQTHNIPLQPDKQLVLMLDGVQDPGNLGTIIRIADWFGIKNMVCSPDTADVYNPKVVQATMGSLGRVSLIYTDLNTYLDTLSPEIPIYGTLLDGKNIYQEPLTTHGIIVMGNEGNGISPHVRAKVNRQLLIPNFSDSTQTAESLNVAIATAIACSEFKRRL